MRKSLIICNMILKTWKKELLKLLDNHTKIFVFCLIMLTMVTSGSVVGYTMTKSIINGFLQTGAEQSLILLVVSMCINTSILSITLFIIFKMITPEHDLYSMMLSWMPVSNAEKNIGFFIPFLITISGISTLIIGILVLPSLIINDFGVLHTSLFFISIFTQSVLIISLSSMVYNSLFYFINKMGVSFSKHLSIITLIIVAALTAVNSIQLDKIGNLAETFHMDVFFVMSAIFVAFLLHSFDLSAGTFFMVLGLFLFIFTLNLASFLFIPKAAEKKVGKPLKILHFSQSKYTNIVVKEILCQLRDKNNILNMITIFFLVIFLKIKIGDSYNSLILLILAVIGGLAAFSSYSNSKSYLSLYKLYNLSYIKVFFGKITALFLLSATQLMLIAILTITVSSENIYGYLFILAINAVFLFFSIGLIIPPSDNTPLISSLSLALMLLIAIPVFFIASYFYSSLSMVSKLSAAVLFELFLVIVSVKLFKWRFNNEYN